MTHSMNEFAALAAQAAAGAGATTAQAGAFGAAAARHLAAGRDAADLGAALSALPGGPIRALPDWLAQAVEAAEGPQVAISLPAGSLAGLARSYVETCVWRCHAGAGPEELVLDLGQPAAPASPARLSPPPDLLATMRSHAARRLVPESARSRAAGAGAGLIDSD